MNEESREELLKREMLKGYVIDKKEQRTVNGNAFEIITYQGDHCDEYLVREVKSGQCWLFYKGVLRISWKETNEGQIGEWTVHERGKTLSVGSDLKLDEVKEIKCQSYYETMNKSDMYHSYLELYKRDGFRWVREGVVEKSSSVLIQQNVDRMIEVNVELHQLLSVNGEVVRGIEHNQVLNLTDEGERWEGDVLCHQPYGWGVLYDIEGEKVYEGFRIGNESVCYGMQYYADIQKVEYEGEICDGKRWGRGIQYDRNGVVVFDGEWLNNEHELVKRMVMNDETQCLHSCIEELIVSDGCCNGEEWSVLDLSCMSYLRLLQVGDDCFRNVNEVKLIGLHVLERVMIGKNSFTTPVEFWILIRNRHGHFYLKDCPSIRELKIGRNSFRDYSVCEIANVPSLEGIEMGEVNELSFNFCFASLELKNLPNLKSLLFGNRAFMFCSRAVFENLPALTSIRLGIGAFWFNEYDKSTELVMKNLPKLTSLTTAEDSRTFRYPRHITLEDMPSLTTVTLDKSTAFREKKTVNIKKITPALQYYLSSSVS